MAGRFFNRRALTDIKKSEERARSLQKREDLNQHPIRFTACGCPDPDCGGWHTILKDRMVPTQEECDEIVKRHNRTRKHP